MVERTPPTDEPTMEEILASIRKIISDDEQPVDEKLDEKLPEEQPTEEPEPEEVGEEPAQEVIESPLSNPTFGELEALVSSGLTRVTNQQIAPETTAPKAESPEEFLDESLEDLRALKRSMASASLENELAEQSDIIFREDDPNEAVDEPAPAPERKPAPDDDVLTLTQKVNEDGSITDVLKKEKVSATADAPVIEETPAEAPVAEMVTLAKLAPDDPLPDSMASFKGDDEVSSDELIANDALELMMVRTMRPMIKRWMDDNLQPIVEKMVREELRRRSMK